MPIRYVSKTDKNFDAPHKARPMRRTRKRRGSKMGPTTKQLARRLNQLENEEEEKYDEIYVPITAGQTVDSLGILLGPMLVAQESSNITRIGDQVTALRAHMEWVVQTTATQTTFPYRLRFIALWDKQSNGVLPPIAGSTSATSILDSTVCTDLTLCPFNHNTTDRFKILYDKCEVVNPIAGDAATALHQRKKKLNINLRKAIIKFSDGNSAITSMVSRQLYYVWCSNVGPVAGNVPTLAFYHRWYFKDS